MEALSMSLSLEEKRAVVAEMSEVLARSKAAIVAEYRGMTVAQMTGLRQQARNSGVQVRVVKNTLTRRAVAGTDFECLTEHLVGPLAVAASEDPVAVAKLLSEFAKSNDKLQVKAGAMSGSLLSAADIAALARLPGREQLLATLVGTLQAPVTKFARTLNELPSGLVRVLAAVRDAQGTA
jgi:large subunit ribosomal protein L10